MRPVGALLPQVGGVAFRRFGFVHAELPARWAEIVGPVYARWSVPQSLRFPRGAKSGGTLTIRVASPFAIQLQHAAPQVIERVNRIFGHAAVARLRLVQGDPPRSRNHDMPRKVAEAFREIRLPNVKDPELRRALEALGSHLPPD